MYSILPFDHAMNSLFDDFESSFFPAAQTQRFPAFRTDISDEGDHYSLQAELPGFQKEDINLNLKDNVLTISAKHEEHNENKDKDGHYVYRERRYGTFQRSFDVSGIQEDGITASYENGILQMNLPKAPEIAEQSRKIAIQ